MRKKPSAYTVFMAVLIVLLILAAALFVYGSVTNGLIKPQLPVKGIFTPGISLPHG